MAPRLRRFLHIERSRPPSSPSVATPPPDAATGRFTAVERRGEQAAAPPVSGAELERFGPEQQPARASGLELGGTAAGERPFTRCARCGMDHHVLAAECTVCGERLDTPEQRAFNDRLWAERREQAAREEAEAAARREAQTRADAELAARRRAMGEELAREVGDAERRRLGDLGSGRWGGGRIAIPRWLARAGGGKLLLGVAIALAAALGLLALAGHPGPLILVGAMILSLLLPGRRRRPWWW